LADVELRAHVDPVQVMTYDWVHNTLQEGTLSTEVQLLLTACEPHGVSRREFQEALQDAAWEFPSQTRTKSKQLHRVFDPYRESAASDRLKCSASELLGLYGLLRYLVAEKVPRVPDLLPKLASFAAACDTLDVLLAAKKGATSIADAARSLPGVMQRHMAAHIEAYGDGGIRPKHHWNLDVGDQLARDGVVLDAFVIERTHLKIKAVADSVENTSRFERSVLAGVLNNTWRESATGSWSHALLGSPKQVAPNTCLSARMRVYGLTLSVNDVVWVGEKCGSVRLCVLADAILYVLVEMYTAVGEHTRHWGQWAPSATHELWVAANVQTSLAWKVVADGVVVVIRC